MTDNVLSNNIKSLVNEFNKMKKQFQEKAKAVFVETVSEFWKLNPKIHAITWVQYTPYFNDGEPCEFGVHELVACTKDSLVQMGTYPDRYEGSYQVDYKSKSHEMVKQEWETSDITLEEYERANDYLDSIAELPGDVFYDMFGDHSRIVMYRDGKVEVDTFDHD